MKVANIISEDLIKQAYSYETFKQLTEDLLAEGRATSNNESDMPLLEFTELNIQRMIRLEKTVSLSPDLREALKNIPEKWYWVVLAEGWCGDVAQNLPPIAKMAEKNPNIELKIFLRDQNPAIMDQYTTEGTRSIPKLICLRASTMEALGTWGPRPEPAQNMVIKQKQELEGNMSRKEMVDQLHETMHKWYAEDNTQTLQQEFVTLIRKWAAKSY